MDVADRIFTESLCYGQVGIDFFAGPSEVLVVADNVGKADAAAMYREVL